MSTLRNKYLNEAKIVFHPGTFQDPETFLDPEGNPYDLIPSDPAELSGGIGGKTKSKPGDDAKAKDSPEDTEGKGKERDPEDTEGANKEKDSKSDDEYFDIDDYNPFDHDSDDDDLSFDPSEIRDKDQPTSESPFKPKTKPGTPPKNPPDGPQDPPRNPPENPPDDPRPPEPPRNPPDDPRPPEPPRNPPDDPRPPKNPEWPKKPKKKDGPDGPIEPPRIPIKIKPITGSLVDAHTFRTSDGKIIKAGEPL